MRACHELGGEQFAILLVFLSWIFRDSIYQRKISHNYKIWVTFLYRSLSLRLKEYLLPYRGFLTFEESKESSPDFL